MYYIKIQKFEKRSEEEIKRIEEARKYGRDFPFDDSIGILGRDDYRTVKALEVELSDEQFEAVRKAVLGVI